MKRVGVGTRVLNFLIDTVLVFLISRAVSAWYLFQVVYWHYPALPSYSFFLITLVVYYLVFEGIWKRTPGKWLSISKVVNKDGTKPNLGQIFIRSLVRIIPIDCFFIPFLEEKTLHDYLSGTEVIEA